MQTSTFLYITKQTGKNLLLILFVITVAITMIDYLQHTGDIQNQANQTILYLFYTWEFRLSQFYPLAIVFSAVVTYMSLVQSNTFVSLFSFGYSKKQLFIPFILPGVLLYIVMIFLQTGSFSYARESAWSIRHHRQSARIVDDLFFKYNESFVYVKTLDPVKKMLTDVTVFQVKNNKVEAAITLDRAVFDGEYWRTENAVMTQKKYAKNGDLAGFKREDTGPYALLKGYKPKVIELIYEGESLSLVDAIHTYQVLTNQQLDTHKIKASFYSKTILPLFAFAVITILFFRASYYARYINKERVWVLSIGGTLVVWGFLYALYSMSSSGAISAELAVPIPIAILLLYAGYLYILGEEKLA